MEMSKKISSIAQYIATFPPEVRKKLITVKKTIREIVPQAEETISYQIPTFKLNGRYLIYFAGFNNHISLYPVPSGSDSFNKQITRFRTGKGTLQFPLDAPLPIPLIRRIVKQRLKDNLSRTGKKTD